MPKPSCSQEPKESLSWLVLPTEGVEIRVGTGGNNNFGLLKENAFPADFLSLVCIKPVLLWSGVTLDDGVRLLTGEFLALLAVLNDANVDGRGASSSKKLSPHGGNENSRSASFPKLQLLSRLLDMP